ncbi:MAG: PilZ domain-containing protein [Rhodospirillales bacterium]|nr:PilZ domain-containing protein [Rhodospirillales bacterium]
MTDTDQTEHPLRKHPRIQMPAMLEVSGKEYEVGNLSETGIGIIGMNPEDKPVGEVFRCRLILPFLGFSLDVDLEVEVRHFEEKNKVLGCRFVNLTQEQTAMLNEIIRSFFSGDVVTSDSLLHVVSRENFVKFRTKDDTPSSPKVLQKSWGTPVLLIIALLLGIAMGYALF